MNVIGLCQGANYRIFTNLMSMVQSDIDIGRLGIFVADAGYYKSNVNPTHQDMVSKACVLKEWESVNEGLNRSVSRSDLIYWQERLSGESLWNAVLADRRLYFGPYCKVTQDYRCRYTDAQLEGILVEACERIEKLFDEVLPDLIVGFVPVTLHEKLCLKFAEKRGVPIRLLRSTKILNYVSFNDSLFGLSRHVKQIENISKDSLEVADRYIDTTKREGARYEGMHDASYSLRSFSALKLAKGLAGGAYADFKSVFDRDLSIDRHYPSLMKYNAIRYIRQPWRAFRERQTAMITNLAELKAEVPSYCFFPLHFEPEIALQIYARPHQNQIEVVRQLALSLPLGMKLVVKDHPRSAGMRSGNFHNQIRNIPNVVTVPAHLNSHALVEQSELVAVITGNIGLEACCIGRPVILLGKSEVGELGEPMVFECQNLYSLDVLIEHALSVHQYSLDSLREYVGRLIQGAVPLDLYSVLLGKKGRVQHGEESFHRAVERLKRYAIERFCV